MPRKKPTKKMRKRAEQDKNRDLIKSEIANLKFKKSGAVTESRVHAADIAADEKRRKPIIGYNVDELADIALDKEGNYRKNFLDEEGNPKSIDEDLRAALVAKEMKEKALRADEAKELKRSRPYELRSAQAQIADVYKHTQEFDLLEDDRQCLQKLALEIPTMTQQWREKLGELRPYDLRRAIESDARRWDYVERMGYAEVKRKHGVRSSGAIAGASWRSHDLSSVETANSVHNQAFITDVFVEKHVVDGSEKRFFRWMSGDQMIGGLRGDLPANWRTGDTCDWVDAVDDDVCVGQAATSPTRLRRTFLSGANRTRPSNSAKSSELAPPKLVSSSSSSTAFLDSESAEIGKRLVKSANGTEVLTGGNRARLGKDCPWEYGEEDPRWR